MMRLAFYARRFGLPLLGAAMCLRMAGDAGARPGPARMAFADAMPKTVVWAWEEPEDLRTADARAVGVAYLDETLLLGEGGGLTVRHRHQPLAVAPGAAVMAVVRIETGRGFADSPGLRLQTADELAEAAQRAGVRTLQVDFDATRSERGFYAAVLRALRLQMPAGMPLSITALASWCGEGGGWLAGLPIDEAVPMFFRLGGDAKPYADKSWIAVREPLCRGSVGISTDESWPRVDGAARVYVFAPRPWTKAQLAAVAGIDTASARPAVLRVGDDPAHAGHGINDTGLPRPAGARQSSSDHEGYQP